MMRPKPAAYAYNLTSPGKFPRPVQTRRSNTLLSDVLRTARTEYSSRGRDSTSETRIVKVASRIELEYGAVMCSSLKHVAGSKPFLK